MKTCISTYSFARLIGSGAMDHFDVLDKIHEMGVPAAELVLDDNTSSSPLEFACRLADHAPETGFGRADLHHGCEFLLPGCGGGDPPGRAAYRYRGGGGNPPASPRYYTRVL